ncbi:HAD family hydrolase, partial [Intestinimonas butyriciproducens]
MGKFEGVLLASDFDDTLVGSDCEVSRGNREALEYFVREGGRFTVSTGRAHRTFAPYVDAAPINAPVILSNGALLYDFRAGRTVVDLPLPVCAAEDLGELCSAIPALG